MESGAADDVVDEVEGVAGSFCFRRLAIKSPMGRLAPDFREPRKAWMVMARRVPCRVVSYPARAAPHLACFGKDRALLRGRETVMSSVPAPGSGTRAHIPIAMSCVASASRARSGVVARARFQKRSSRRRGRRNSRETCWRTRPSGRSEHRVMILRRGGCIVWRSPYTCESRCNRRGGAES